MKTFQQYLTEASKTKMPKFKSESHAMKHFEKHAHHVMSYLAKKGSVSGAHEAMGDTLEDIHSNLEGAEDEEKE